MKYEGNIKDPSLPQFSDSFVSSIVSSGVIALQLQITVPLPLTVSTDNSNNSFFSQKAAAAGSGFHDRFVREARP